MTYKLVHGAVLDRPRQVVNVVRVIDEILNFAEINDIAEKVRDHILSRRGEQAANVVTVRGSSQDRCTYVGGDMFREVPPADAYFLNMVLHDCSDQECIEILANLSRAVSCKARVLVVEHIVMSHTSRSC